MFLTNDSLFDSGVHPQGNLKNRENKVCPLIFKCLVAMEMNIGRIGLGCAPTDEAPGFYGCL